MLRLGFPRRLGPPLILAVLALGTPRPVAAEPGARASVLPVAAPPAAPAPVPLSANFSRFELVASATVAVAGATLMLFGTELFGAPAAGMGPPAASSFDARWARRLAISGDRRFLGGVTDVGGIYVWPALPAIVYGLDVAGRFDRGRPFVRTGELSPHHRLAAYVEAMGLTMFVTGATKSLVGRARPYTEVALDRPELRRRSSEDQLSFFSGHSSVAFATGAFVSADVSRALLRGPLAQASTSRRVFLGHLLPAVVGYGVPTLVGISRVIDQQHWPSDVLVGALVGGLIGHWAYTRHFDERGDPRERLALRAAPLVVVHSDGPAVWGMGMSARF
ncbi:MAG TPA: phosphatase PAP2 family protein [Polyangia bacterium]